MPSTAKKHEILGGIKVSSQQLAKWGKTGGRPQLYSSNAERAKAFRLRKKQEKLGGKVELRGYRSYEEQPINSLLHLICDKCHSKSIGSFKHLGEKCGSCFLGWMVKDSSNISKRAGSSGERWRRWRGESRKSPPPGGIIIKQEKQREKRRELGVDQPCPWIDKKTT